MGGSASEWINSERTECLGRVYLRTLASGPLVFSLIYLGARWTIPKATLTGRLASATGMGLASAYFVYREGIKSCDKVAEMRKFNLKHSA